MNKDKIRVGVIGTGFIGAVHIDAIRRLGFTEIAGIAEASPELAESRAGELGIARAYRDAGEMINDPDVDVIHNCTPNNLHLEINRAIIRAGKHIFAEKPLAMNAGESALLLEDVSQSNVVHGVNFNYRMYPLVQEMKHRVARGYLGDLRIVHGSYLQDWLLYPTDYNWRVEPEFCGATRAVGDLGSHWCDLVQTVTGLRIVEVMAEFMTAVPLRRKAGDVSTFGADTAAGAGVDIAVDTEDWATVMVRLENGVKGVFSVSQVSAGRKCRFDVEINGSEKTFYWNQERGDRLWVGTRGESNEEIIRDPNRLDPAIRPYTSAPVGHPEGWLDDNHANIRAFYDFIREGKRPGIDPAAFATFHDGHDIMLILDAIVESAHTGRWVSVRRGKC